MGSFPVRRKRTFPRSRECDFPHFLESHSCFQQKNYKITCSNIKLGHLLNDKNIMMMHYRYNI